MSNNNELCKASARENKTKATAVAMMVAQRKLPNKEEAYDKYACYHGSTATMESCDDKECKERSSGPINYKAYEDEPTYKEEFTNYTYKCTVAY